MRGNSDSFLLILLLMLLLVCPPPLVTAVIVVDGTCTLVDAITAANSDSATGDCPAGSGADEIQVTVDVTLTTVDNTADGDNGLPSITSDVRIQGTGGLRAIARDPAAPEFRILHIAASGTVDLNNLALMNGDVVGPFPDNRGAAIFNRGRVTLLDSTVSGNTTVEEGGGVVNLGGATLILDNSTVSGNSAGNVGGGIFTEGTVIVTDSAISDNSASYGGGIFSEDGTVTLTSSTVSGNSVSGFAGGIWNYGGTLTLTNSTVSGNSAPTGGGIYNRYGIATLTNSVVSGNSTTSAYAGGGGIVSTGSAATMTLTDSTVSGNSTTGYGSGGGIYNRYYSTMILNSSTVSNNSANYGGGIYNKGDSANLTLTNSTVSGNSTTTGYALGGGIYNRSGETTLINSTVAANAANGGAIANRDGTVTLTGSLLANSAMGVNCWLNPSLDPITDGGNNLADDDTCGTIPDNLAGLDPNLADNGGYTLTHALLSGSSAIDAAGDCGLVVDQRGAGRITPCDSGAFEAIGCELLELENLIIATDESFSTCNTALLGPLLMVEGSDGKLTVRAGYLLTARNGFVVNSDAEADLGIDPSLLPP
jgi:hypothetical protein